MLIVILGEDTVRSRSYLQQLINTYKQKKYSIFYSDYNELVNKYFFL